MSARPSATAALWGKAWRQSRARFSISAAALAAMCLWMTVLQQMMRQASGAPQSELYSHYLYVRIYLVVRVFFVVFAIVLALGGLQRERAHQALLFTLALPVSRGAHLRSRAGVGLLQLAALAAIPALLVPLGSLLGGASYAWLDAARFALLWFSFGGTVFALSLLISVLVRTDYVALLLPLIGMRLVPAAIAQLSPAAARPLQLDRLMSARGLPELDAATGLLRQLPWNVLTGAWAATAVLVALACLAIERERFSS